MILTPEPDAPTIEYDELATLKHLAIKQERSDGGIRATCSGLAEELHLSDQTISRRLRRLHDGGLLFREFTGNKQLVYVTGDGERLLRQEYERYAEALGERPYVLTGEVTACGAEETSSPEIQTADEVPFDTVSVRLTTPLERTPVCGFSPESGDSRQNCSDGYHPVVVETTAGRRVRSAWLEIPTSEPETVSLSLPARETTDRALKSGTILTMWPELNYAQ